MPEFNVTVVLTTSKHIKNKEHAKEWVYRLILQPHGIDKRAIKEIKRTY